MSAPYFSIKRLLDNSLAAMLAAVGVYNKPQMTYRDEATVMLIINAWELALKATLLQKNRSIFCPKQRGERYRSVGLDDALRWVAAELGIPISSPTSWRPRGASAESCAPCRATASRSTHGCDAP